ncbi:MAG: OmpA family protein [Myxococcales bacterium]|nr:OmpA family protein [Myxococcales bacterium]
MAKVRQLQGALNDAEQSQKALEERLASVRAKNATLSKRLSDLGENVSQLQDERSSLQSSVAQLQERERQAQARAATFQELINRFRKAIAAGKLSVRVVRNRMIVELPSGVLFASGSAEVKSSGQTTLAEVASVLKDIPSRDFQVAGHTDDVPIHTARFRNNWDLSTARAVNVVLFLIDHGLAANRLSAAGYADTQPVASNETADGRAHNRRIEIVLLPNLDELPDLSSLEQKPAAKP